MKALFITFLIMISLKDIAFTQCGIDQKELRDKYCEGSYLVHSVLYSSSPVVELALKDGNNYAIYLINQIHQVLGLSLTDSHNNVIDLPFRHNENFSVYTFAPKVTDTYKFSVNFGTFDDACVLWAVYLQNENHLKAGFYKTFDDMKFNNPSGVFNYRINSTTRKYNGNELDFYNLSIDKRTAKSIGRIFGFSDGVNIFVNERIPLLRPGTEFVKIEFMYRYFYFEDVQQLIIPNGSSTVTVPKVEQKIMDMNTGEITVLNNRTLRDLISDNPRLLGEFNNDSQRNRKLKDYLKIYLENNYRD